MLYPAELRGLGDILANAGDERRRLEPIDGRGTVCSVLCMWMTVRGVRRTRERHDAR
jgi:hypothetical protein